MVFSIRKRTFSGSIYLDKREKGKTREDCRRIGVDVNLEELRGCERSIEIKIG
jgi:hypothetical protein